MGTVFGLAWPIMVSMLSRTAMTTADTLFVGRLGTTHLAAIGLAGVASFLGIAFGMGLLGGVNVAVAHRTGAQDHAGARALWWQAMYIALALSVVVASTFWTGPWIFPILGATEGTTELAGEWFSLRVLGSPLAFGMFALTAWFQGRGDTKTPMVAVVLSNVLNIALDPLFIFGWGPLPELGIAGAAHATNLAQAVGLGFLIWRSQSDRGAFVRPNRLELAEIWRLGSPLAVWFFLDVLAFGLFVSLLARAGEAELAAHVVVIRIMSVSFLPGHAVGEAGGVLVGQALGARRPELARQAWRSAARLAVGVMAVCAFVFILVPEWLLWPFGLDEEVIAVAMGLMVIGAFFQVFDGLAMTALGALKGAGDTRFTMFTGVLSSWLVKLPLGAWLAIGTMGLGAGGAWLGLTADIIVLAVLATWRIESGGWLKASQERAVSEAEPDPERAAVAAK
ncbi:MAG: MATE family efflux transporter [Proteobacteria bacterium]|nr:MATE family efflux transporter [Pseudomonadota bacterium]MCP4915443.1 MATE family efflux transporter [Pseudomonadota bacterium]